MIDTGGGGERLMAEVFALSEFGQGAGIVFADIGWTDPASHPFHVVPGNITETEEGWQVGDRSVRIAFDGEDMHANWQVWRDLPAGMRFNPDACLQEIKRSGILSTADTT